MKEVTDQNFGVIIAFWLPGFLLLWGLSYSSPEISAWLAKSSAGDAPTVGGFLYASLASLALGLLISAIRWAIVEQFLYRATGLRHADIDDTKLKNKDTLAAFQAAIQNHFRYYQYYSNTFVAIVSALLFNLAFAKEKVPWWAVMLVIVIAVILIFASRSEPRSFNERAGEITR
jgi:hypothetical protein